MNVWVVGAEQQNEPFKLHGLFLRQEAAERAACEDIIAPHAGQAGRWYMRVKFALAAQDWAEVLKLWREAEAWYIEQEQQDFYPVLTLRYVAVNG